MAGPGPALVAPELAPELTAARPPRQRRSVLFLQGPASTLWAEVADRFAKRGHAVHRVNLTLGDWLYWRRRGAINYRGSLTNWESWLEALLRREGVTDIVYFADRLPYHRVAARLAARMGLRAWAVENGYLRPDWLTLEPVAMGRHSHFTRCPETIGRLAEGRPLPSFARRYPVPFRVEAMNEVLFNLAHIFGRPLFPHYVSDKAVAPALEYLGWLPHLVLAGPRRRAATRVERRLCGPGAPPFFLVTLQMETDYQIRASSDFTSQRDMLEIVIGSFARRAEPGAELLVKVHPFDNGLISWQRVAARLAGAFGVARRVSVVRGGNLERMVAAARGLVTINSTSAVQALRAGCPVVTLGDAIFDLPGLTHQSGLERFWAEPEAPEASFFDNWCRAVAAEIQLRGSQMNPEGRAAAAAEIVRRIEQADRYWQLYPPPGAETKTAAPGSLGAAAEPMPSRHRAVG
ncbi:MAG: capsular biosynthesis protein [Pseudomonadota bacterium]